ncbi:PAS domain-containing protein [Ideonella sp. A 288]|uniref:PAS domain-containing protein n=1 Tax=Ideonella sp. A 288 TaxID=1962181 RepID=UPI000B4AF1A8|nr:PAS domain-containing protein [Ideonella sp. A 288]
MARMHAAPPSPMNPQTATPFPWVLGLALAVPLLQWLAPRYEASGVLVAPLAAALVLALGLTALVGWRALPWVGAGALIGAFGWPLGLPDAQAVVGALTLFLQAAAGGLLLRRSGRPDDLALDSRVALRRLLAAALVCGVIGGLLQMLGDMIWSAEPTLRPGALALVRATADAASIVLLLPVLLAFVSPQRERWRPRQRSVALPLAALAAMMLVAFALINDRDRQQAQQRFERDAEVVFARVQVLLDAPIQALQALQGAFLTSGGTLTALQFDSLAQPWIRRSIGLGSIGWLDVQAPAAPPALAPPTGSASAVAAAAAPPPVVPRRGTTVRHSLGAVPMLAIEASASASAPAPTVTVFESTALRQSAARAAQQSVPTASPPVALGTATDARPGFVVFQGLPMASPTGLRPLAFATVSAETLIAPILAARSDALRACLFDTDARLEQRRLAGASGCEHAFADDAAFSREAAFDYGGRRWALRVSQPVRTTGSVWLFALPALAGGALLAVLLAGMTGQVQRVRHEARTRTDELRHEIDLRARTQAIHERTVHALMETVQTGMAMVDPDGRIQRVNQGFAELAGEAPEDLLHRSLDDVLLDVERPSPGRFARLIQDAGDVLVPQTLQLRNADGRTVPSLVTLRVLRDDSGRAMSAVCAVHDLSENLRRRQVEQVLGNVLDLSRGDGRSTVPAQTTAAPDHRLLCIAGDAGLADELRTALHDRKRISLLAASGGPEGLVTARTESPRLVLLDLDLPDADSLALMRTLTDEGLPVIAMSRDLRPQRIDEAFAAGARAYLTLPPEPRELLAVIDDLI